MDQDAIFYKKTGHKAYIIINRPDKLNALTMPMYVKINDFFEQADDDPEVRVVILKGAGRAFSAGYDINEGGNDDAIAYRRSIEKCSNKARWTIWNLSKPVIAQIHGFCLGGACELAMPCDYLIATEDVKIGEPEIQFGETPAFMMMPWVVGVRKAKELLLTGEQISGVEAAACGLVTKAVPAAQLEEEVEKLANKVIKISPPAIFMQKRGINRAYEIAGFNAAIASWVDIGLWINVLKTDEVIKFNEIVREQGVKAALKWKDDYFATE